MIKKKPSMSWNTKNQEHIYIPTMRLLRKKLMNGISFTMGTKHIEE
jgi:hypothetical protein